MADCSDVLAYPEADARALLEAADCKVWSRRVSSCIPSPRDRRHEGGGRARPLLDAREWRVVRCRPSEGRGVELMLMAFPRYAPPASGGAPGPGSGTTGGRPGPAAGPGEAGRGHE